MSSSTTWTDPYSCPFCGEELPSPGEGFVRHVDDNPECDAAFETWRERVAEDVRGGWSG